MYEVKILTIFITITKIGKLFLDRKSQKNVFVHHRFENFLRMFEDVRYWIFINSHSKIFLFYCYSKLLTVGTRTFHQMFILSYLYNKMFKIF